MKIKLFIVLIFSTMLLFAQNAGKPVEKANNNDMVLVKGGTFQMGSEYGEDDEKPVHIVILDDFYIGKNEVTYDEYEEYCYATAMTIPEDKGKGRGKRPVVWVNWYNAIDYCNWRSEKEGLERVYSISNSKVSANWNANGYRLPTEAEWEFAARSRGSNDKWSGTSNQSDLMMYANGLSSEDGFIVSYNAPVGTFKPNDLGINDMSGNASEWCWDIWTSQYPSNQSVNPHGPENGRYRIHRGGSSVYSPNDLRCTKRFSMLPENRHDGSGFRLARNAK